MDLGRLTLGEAVAVVSGVALILFMFLPWYGVESFGFDLGDLNANAWEALGGLDVVMLLLALTVAGTGLAIVLRDQLRMAITPVFIVSIVCAGAAGLLAILILIKLVSPPGGTSVEVGAILAFAAALVAAAGRHWR